MLRALPQPKPNPRPLAEPLRTELHVLRNRHLKCSEYDRCLVIAANPNWPSFTCQSCELWPKELRPGLRAPSEDE